MLFSFRMRKVKCPDGSVKVLHRDPSKAFPLALQDVMRKASATADGLKSVTADASIEVQRQIKTLLVEIDESNRSMQADFAAIYQAFCSDPCHESGYLQTRVDRLIQERRDFQYLLVQAQLVRDLIAKGASSADVAELLVRTQTNYLPPNVAKTQELIGRAPRLVEEWADGDSANQAPKGAAAEDGSPKAEARELP